MTNKKVKVTSHIQNIITMPRALVIEITSDHFTDQSGIFLPCGTDYSTPTGLIAIKAVLMFVQEFPEKKLLITGHIENQPTVKKGFSFAAFRARAAHAVLTGTSANWVAIAKMSKISDYKKILKYIDKKYSWGCDPLSDDDTVTDDYHNSIKKFKENYNTVHKPKPLLNINDKIESATLTAFFHLYQHGIAELLGETDVDGLKKWHKSLKFINTDKKHLGCGSSIKHSTDATQGAKSQNGERVEFVFFTEKNCPKLKCVTSNQKEHLVEKCPVASKWVIREYLDSEKIAAGSATLLNINTIDDHFAPQYETLSITYDIQNLIDKTVILQITSDSYKENPIFERTLNDIEKQDGTNKNITWDGETTCKGELEGLFINPLFSPYKVSLKSVGGAESFKEVKVLYGKIVLEEGPWDAGRPASKVLPDEATEPVDWLRYRLNDLGYWGGPCTNDETQTALQKEYLKKAISFYAKNDQLIHNRGPFDINNVVAGKDVLFNDQLRKNENRRTYLEDLVGDVFTNQSGTAKVYVPSIYYLKSGDFFAGGESRANEDKKIVNDPVIPILASIRILNKANQSVDAPEAVGKVNLAWHVEDCIEGDSATRYQVHVSYLAGNRHTAPGTPDEPDMQVFNVAAVPPSDDTQRLLYMQQVSSWIAGKKYEYSDGTLISKNCPAICGGKTKLSEIFHSYRPFTLSTKGKRPVSETSVFNEVLGKTGVYFSPSSIGGDSYRIVVDFDFTKQKNEKILKTQYSYNSATNETSLITKTGIFTIWRDTKFNTIISWPGCAIISDYELNRIQQNYEQAYIEMKTPTAADCLDITTIINNNNYQEIIKPFKSENLKNFYRNQSFSTLSAADRTSESNRFVADSSASTTNLPSWVLTKDCVYGRALPAQNNIPGANYENALQALFYHQTNGFIYKTIDKMAQVVGKEFRKQRPYGHAIIAFYPHKPVTILTDPVGSPGVVMKNNYVAGFVSMGQADGIVTYDLGDTDRRGYVVTHEFGHHNFLYHHENASDVNPRHHDLNDHNCIMSYPGGIAPAISEKSNPLYCGKCNLRLRGWRITGNSVPASS